MFKPYADHVGVVYESQFIGDQVEGGANGRDFRLEYGKASGMLNRGNPDSMSGSVREISWMPNRQASMSLKIFSMRT